MDSNTEKIFFSYSETETEKFASEIAASLEVGSTVLLRGDLGAGKTVFSRGFARGLGCDDTLSSPTYTIVQEYMLPGNHRLYHMDLYRIADANSALGFGVDEFIDDPKAFKLIEWPERIESLLPQKCINVQIIHKGDEEREIRVKR
ncbi:MAG: tRNA (adenosine(37)-N6)-threonylcarbamoyltransferase complex ATPase subunit type 1 TsaE [Lentisphaeria bacterium]|nr:tRNA (adenosine(37)-N6)-threonylcarbamoyltransferase complex ATPase subunit type 1 TsaE [Lentisphaeria bacterium]